VTKSINPKILMSPADNQPVELPELQVLMAAVIRLMAKCIESDQTAPAGALLKLIKELRSHPDLSRRPAILAGLAEAHSIWLQRVTTMTEREGLQDALACSGADPKKCH